MRHRLATLTMGLVLSVPVAHAGFVDYVIRNSTVGNIAPTINHLPGGVTQFLTLSGGQKAALGSSDIDGRLLGDITRLAITRLDDRANLTVGSGPYVAPYINIWITDGSGNYAVIANEPSNPEWNGYYNNGYDLDWADLAGKTLKVFENNDKSWLPNNGVGLTFASLANFMIQAPTVAELTTGWAGLGGGAPRELGSNLAYGVNWVFGDTQSNYVGGYKVSNPVVSAPDSASLSVFGLAALALLLGRRFLRN